MKRKSFFVLSLLALSAIAGYLLSKASFVGRAGITLFYRQYQFLKVWWQGGLLLFVVWMILFFLQNWARQKRSPATARLVHIGTIVLAVIGLFFTYQDFRNTTSHRWLGERFHLGAYLFWLGWIIIGVYYLMEKRSSNVSGSTLPGTASAPQSSYENR